MDYHSKKSVELDADARFIQHQSKIMTSIIVFDLLKKNKISLDDLYVVSEKHGDYLKVATHQCLL